MISKKVNYGNITKGLDDYLATVKKATRNALMQTGFNVLEQAEPLAPIDEGTLIGSGYAQVGSKSFKKESDTPPIVTTAKDTELNVGYTVEYAGRLHENPFTPGVKSVNKGLTEPGYKWLTKTIKAINITEMFKGLLDNELKRK
jgi:hypothetical protein